MKNKTMDNYRFTLDKTNSQENVAIEPTCIQRLWTISKSLIKTPRYVCSALRSSSKQLLDLIGSKGFTQDSIWDTEFVWEPEELWSEMHFFQSQIPGILDGINPKTKKRVTIESIDPDYMNVQEIIKKYNERVTKEMQDNTAVKIEDVSALQ